MNHLMDNVISQIGFKSYFLRYSSPIHDLLVSLLKPSSLERQQRY